MNSESAFREALEKLQKYDSWAVFCHESPDGDTLGSALALVSAGKRLGKAVTVYSKDPLPQVYSFFPYAEELRVINRLNPEEVKESLLITVDTSTEKRSLENLPELAASAKDSLSIDHHGDNTRFAKTNLIDDTASATAEIITRVIKELTGGITRTEAEALYTALSTDNGSFRFSSTTPASHLCAAALLEAGAEPAHIDDRINENLTEPILKLWGKALAGLTVFASGRCAMLTISEEEIKEADADSSSLDGLVNMLMRIKGVKCALFLTERENCCKLSVRTRSGYSAREIASEFGGGGHINAAGAKISTDFKEAREKIKEVAENYVRKRNTCS